MPLLIKRVRALERLLMLHEKCRCVMRTLTEEIINRQTIAHLGLVSFGKR